METERVITLPTEPTEGEIVKSHPLFSFINIGQRGRIFYLFILSQEIHLFSWGNTHSEFWSNMLCSLMSK